MNLRKASFPVLVISLLLLCAIELFLSAVSVAQRDLAGAQALERGPFGAELAISPDGASTAYFGKDYPGAIYEQNIGSAQARLILKYNGEYGDWDVVNNLDFSPDGRSLLFEAGPARMFAGHIYVASRDRHALRVLASDAQLVTGTVTTTPGIVPSAPGGFYDIAYSNPLYSPDGKTVLVTVNISNGIRDKQGRIDASQIRSYIGLLLLDKAQQQPAILKELRGGESVLFWGSEGAGVYYSSEDGLVHRIDILTKTDTTIENTRDMYILGRVPGTNFVFVRTAGANAVGIRSFDANIPSQSLISSAARIPPRDSAGRPLHSIKGAGPQRFFVTYKGVLSAPSSSREHSEVIGLQ